MIGSLHPQRANDYKLTGTDTGTGTGLIGTPAKQENAKVWYYEFPGRLEFHMSLYAGNHYRGHVTFSVQRAKLLKSLKRLAVDKG